PCCISNCYLPSFPTRRSSDLDLITHSRYQLPTPFHHIQLKLLSNQTKHTFPRLSLAHVLNRWRGQSATKLLQQLGLVISYFRWPDRKSTRLNSSHVKISYAVF